MTPQEKQLLENIAYRLNVLDHGDRYVFTKNIETFANIKIGFFGVNSVVQPATIADPSGPGTIYSQSEIQSIVTAVIAITNTLKALGLIKS